MLSQAEAYSRILLTADTEGITAADHLLAWYRRAARDLPWRHTDDPYRIWISEIMLQQTRAAAVIPYYERFLSELPNAEALAEVSDERLLKLWEGLGYYSRARNLKKAASVICSEYGGLLPSEPSLLRDLPGIGSYTAGAIASFAWQLPCSAVDGNVLRVTARLLGDTRNILEPGFKRDAELFWQNLLRDPAFPKGNAGDFNQALIELGATLCGPDQKASCESCPWNSICRAHLEGSTDRIPLRIKKNARRVERLTVLLVRDGEETAIRRRPAAGLLAGLYEYPHLEGFISSRDVLAFLNEKGYDSLYIRKLPPSKHLFTHIEWRMHAWEIRIAPRENFDRQTEDWIFADEEALKTRYPLPSAFSAYSGRKSEIF